MYSPCLRGGGDAFLPCSGASEYLGELTSKGPIPQVALPSPRFPRTSSSSDDFTPGANLGLFEMAPLGDQTAAPPPLAEGLRRTFPPKPLLTNSLRRLELKGEARGQRMEPASLAAFCLK